MLDDLEQATASTDQTLDHPRVLLLRTQVATDAAPWLPTPSHALSSSLTALPSLRC